MFKFTVFFLVRTLDCITTNFRTAHGDTQRQAIHSAIAETMLDGDLDPENVDFLGVIEGSLTILQWDDTPIQSALSPTGGLEMQKLRMALNASQAKLDKAILALESIYAAAQSTGRWLGPNGAECESLAIGANWSPYDKEEQTEQLDAIAGTCGRTLSGFGVVLAPVQTRHDPTITVAAVAVPAALVSAVVVPAALVVAAPIVSEFASLMAEYDTNLTVRKAKGCVALT